MNKKKTNLDKLLVSLQERAKELNCLYQVEEILRVPELDIETIMVRILEVIPAGWQYPDICKAKILYEGQTYTSKGFIETPWRHSADIIARDIKVGTLFVYYTKEMPAEDFGPFLREETKLIQTIAQQLAHRILFKKIRSLLREMEATQQNGTKSDHDEWLIILKMLMQTDYNLYARISQKMLNHLCWSGIKEAEKLLESYGASTTISDEELTEDWNRPLQRREMQLPSDFSETAFEIATRYLSDKEILNLIQKWIYEDRLSFLVQVVNRNLSLSEVADAIRRYHSMKTHEPDVFSPSKIGIHVSLIRRFLSDQLAYLSIAKDYIGLNEFYQLLEKVIYSTESHGKLGGKSAGLYLARQILKKKASENKLLENVKMPKTWYITSDVLLGFMHYNNFDEVVEQKYKEINQVRLEYPHIEQSFKNATFPPDIVKGLSLALDDFGTHPLIVRSSSLLEDRAGSAFSGKYKSLFLANQGTKKERLLALMDAISEVYASTFSPDPIEYRSERGLIDFGEEMGIMIQEVVGEKVGKYFLPAWAGVAFSRNEFRWSPRIKREDGLIRLVPGLGTRAVDRLTDDYPILIAPGQPGLSVNVTPDEILRYSPQEIDVINLETNDFETLSVAEFFKNGGSELKGAQNIISVYKDGRITRPNLFSTGDDEGEIVATFEGLVNSTPYIKQIHAILITLEQTLGYPVDIEFASTGKDFYLLQCRPQSSSKECRPAAIPKDISKKNIVFSANKHISNGYIPDITHIVYVDPKEYGELPTRQAMLDVGRAISKLNQLLPKHQFILMGPGRWGSRGDIKLGVNVTYSDINNTSVLVEIAFKKGNYLPDLSFGTHFFQDLVEASIRYLPLYPDDKGVEFNENFLTKSRNILGELLPDYARLENVIRLIDVPQNAHGRILRILMNADLDEAVGILTAPGGESEPSDIIEKFDGHRENYWDWRLLFAEKIAAQTDPEKFGIEGMYVFGSTKNATAGPGSDIDLLIHFKGTDEQRGQLILWLDGWSKCLAEMNYLRTGYISDEGLLDIHIITEADIKNKSSFAVKINAVTDAARPLAIGTAAAPKD